MPKKKKEETVEVKEIKVTEEKPKIDEKTKNALERMVKSELGVPENLQHAEEKPKSNVISMPRNMSIPKDEKGNDLEEFQVVELEITDHTVLEEMEDLNDKYMDALNNFHNATLVKVKSEELMNKAKSEMNRAKKSIEKAEVDLRSLGITITEKSVNIVMDHTRYGKKQGEIRKQIEFKIKRMIAYGSSFSFTKRLMKFRKAFIDLTQQ